MPEYCVRSSENVIPHWRLLRARLERASIAYDEALAACHENPSRQAYLLAIECEARWEAALQPFMAGNAGNENAPVEVEPTGAP